MNINYKKYVYNICTNKYVYSRGSCARLVSRAEGSEFYNSRNQGLPFCLSARLWVHAVNIWSYIERVDDICTSPILCTCYMHNRKKNSTSD